MNLRRLAACAPKGKVHAHFDPHASDDVAYAIGINAEDFPYLQSEDLRRMANLTDFDVCLDPDLTTQYHDWEKNPDTFCVSLCIRPEEGVRPHMRRLKDFANGTHRDLVDRVRSRFLVAFFVEVQELIPYCEAGLKKSHKRSFYYQLIQEFGIGSLFFLPAKIAKSM